MGPGNGLALVIVLVAVRRRGEVVSDSYARPFAPFGFVCGGDRHLGCAFIVELVDGSEDGAGAMGVDEVDEWLEVAAGRVLVGVVPQFTPGREEEEFGVGRAAALFEVVGGPGQGHAALPLPDRCDAVARFP